MGKEFYNSIQDSPIVAAVNAVKDLEMAIKSDCEIIFLLTGNIFNLRDMVEKIKCNNKLVYLHIDLLEGFSRDLIALKYIYENMKPDGIITTKSSLIKKAKEMNIFAIQRLFILDSLSLETGIKSIQNIKPDAIEILPGIMPKIIKKISDETKLPLIAGGLIEDKEDVIESLKAGAIGVSSSNKKIWQL
ncbi:glycerol-3-phosphate responsive antiterminator [Clostridium formicaceticum]|uniref:Antiterminator n=1 Tax=Clostridium formicaceticum TaxID=1497 RepID=A0AAC9RJQ7_9CLOT|nr:glycerol-3-phosphate responsive antiterminator [Clostridium formicaceticum]AOY75984.1 antiterminator [Clostridium formicaceticum]ARE86333.1 Glycerol-3-phosphate responsive antiterminator [Clostridium formicaceticum]